MSFCELALIAIGLSMDAFAVAICKGLAVKTITPRVYIVSGLYFGLFQALMPLIGYSMGRSLSEEIAALDHWIAFLLLAVIALKMLYDARKAQPLQNDSFSPRVMLPLALATSIDALALGVGFAFLHVNLFQMVAVIGSVTFILSAIGIRIGAIAGIRFRSKAELLGGIILFLMGIKILAEHLIVSRL